MSTLVLSVVVGARSPSSFYIINMIRLGRSGLSVVATQHLVDVFERLALRLRQSDRCKQGSGEIDGGQDGEGRTVAEPRRQRAVHVGAGGARRQPDEAAGGRGDAAHRLREQLGVENARDASPAERVDGHEESDAGERQPAGQHCHPPAAAVAVHVQHRRIGCHITRPPARRRRVRRRHVTGSG